MHKTVSISLGLICQGANEENERVPAPGNPAAPSVRGARLPSTVSLCQAIPSLSATTVGPAMGP